MVPPSADVSVKVLGPTTAGVYVKVCGADEAVVNVRLVTVVPPEFRNVPPWLSESVRMSFVAAAGVSVKADEATPNVPEAGDGDVSVKPTFVTGVKVAEEFVMMLPPDDVRWIVLLPRWPACT